MKRLTLILIFTILICAPAMWATAYTATQSGDFNTNATWGGSGHPTTSSDTAAIGSTFAVTCAASATCVTGTLTTTSTASMKCLAGSTCNFGTNTGTNYTIDVTVGAGTRLWIENGGGGTNATLNLTGSITNNGTVSLDGTTVCTPNGAGIYQRILNNSPGVTDAVTLEFVGISSNHAKFRTTGTGGNCYISAASNVGKLSTNYADFERIGDGTNPIYLGTQSGNPSTISVANTWFDNVSLGSIQTRGNVNFTWDNVAWTNPIAYSTRYGNFNSYDTTASSGIRRMTNFGIFFDTGTNPANATVFGMYGLNIGKSTACGDATDVPGIVAVNVILSSTGANNRLVNVKNSIVIGVATSGEGLLTGWDSYASDTFCNGASYLHIPNQHHFVGGGSNRSANPLVISYMLFDGDNYYNGDAGDDLLVNGQAVSCLNCLHINKSGTVDTTNNPATAHTIKYNTAYGAYGLAIGETTGGATQLTELTGNILAAPATPVAGCQGVNDGIHQVTNFVPQTSPIWGYNVGFAMPNSGDPGAGTCTVSALVEKYLVNTTTGTVTFVPWFTAVRNSMAAVAVDGSGNTTTHVQCTSCNFNATDATIVGDYVCLYSGAYPCGRITAKIDLHNLTMDTVPGFTNSVSMRITKSFVSAGTAYGGSGFGDTDFKANPNFRNSAWTICTWYNSVNPSGALTCANSSSDTVEIVQIARDMFCAIAGQTYDGSGPCTPIAGLTVPQMMDAARWAYTPMNGALAHSGNPSDTDAVGGGVPSPGWVPAYPVAILSSN